MTEAFCGKWVPDITSLKGAVEYLETVAAPRSQLDDIKNTEYMDIYLDDKVYKITTHVSGKEPRNDVFKLGEDNATVGPGEIAVMSHTKFENNHLTSVMSVLGVEIKVDRYVKDGVMLSEFTSRGKTMTFSLKRV